MTWTDLAVALVIALGLVLLIIPVFPGLLLVGGAILVWAVLTGTTTGWVIFAAAMVALAIGTVVKYTIPQGRLRTVGIPSRTQWIGAAAGIVGFFVIPVVGLFIGFVLGVYLAEALRVGPAPAWRSTIHALKAVGMSMVIEFAAGALAAFIWVAGVILT